MLLDQKMYPTRLICSVNLHDGPPLNNRYKAFISYSHSDESWARWLHRKLEHYRLPQSIRDSTKLKNGGLRPIFRDRDELASSGSLNAAILDALQRSDALIVICSPAAAKSNWVNREISEFCRVQRADRVFCCIVEGDPPGVFPEAIAALGEPLAADFRKARGGRRDGLTKLVAGLLGLGLDELRRREAQTRRRRQAVITGASAIGMVITTGLAAWAWVAQQQAVEARQQSESRRAQAENLLGFMVGDLRSSLEPLGRLDLLDIVADQAMTYFKQPNIGEVSDGELTVRARILTQIGEIKTDRYLYEEALAAFTEAHTQSRELSLRHPSDAAILFERSQAEYWVGYIQWRIGKLDDAAHWLSVYRDSALKLTLLEPDEDDWITELAYANHNLGVLALEQDDPHRAFEVFQAEAAAFGELITRSPEDVDLREAFADTISWLGTASSRRGDLATALDYQSQSKVAREALASEHPDNLHLQLWKAVALGNEASAHAMLGRIAAAEMQYALAQQTVQDLLESDPGNQQWRRFLLSTSVDRTELALHPSYSPLPGFDAATDLRTAMEGLIQLREAEPLDRRAALALLKAYRIRLAFEQDEDPAEAAVLAEAAWELAISQYERGGVDPLMASEIYQLLVLSRARQLPGNPGRDRIAADVRNRALQSDFPRLLDALSRDLAFSGDADAEAIRARLASMAYQPLQPWPATAGK